MISIIVAVAANNAIGRGNRLLWHLSQDLKYFKEVTTGHPVVMGRKTYESIGRPLPGRRNIVLTRSGKLENVQIKNPATTTLEAISGIEEFLKLAQEAPQEEFFILGGGELYRTMLPYADKLYITHIEATVEDADTFFPQIEPEIWSLERCSQRYSDQENNLEFRHALYTRK
mgnify:FL=1